MRPGVSQEWYNAVDHRTFQKSLKLSKTLQVPIKSAQVSQLCPILAHKQRWILGGHSGVNVLLLPQEELSQLNYLSKDKETVPTSLNDLLLSLSCGTAAVAWRVRCACALFETLAFQSLFQYQLWIHSSPQTWNNWTIVPHFSHFKLLS